MKNKVTPGPYKIVSFRDGFRVEGYLGALIAWFSSSVVYGSGERHQSCTITMKQAKANAKLLLDALNNTVKQTAIPGYDDLVVQVKGNEEGYKDPCDNSWEIIYPQDAISKDS